MGEDACSEPEDHLLPDARAALALPVEERIRYAQRDRWIGYPAAEMLLQRLRDLVQEPRQNRSHGILVAGRPNNGKTSLLARFRAENPFVVVSDGTCEGPVVSMQMPDEPDEGKFWSQMLLALKIPHRASDPAKVLKGQAKDTLEAQRGWMLLIDDVHDVFRGGPMKQRHVLTLIKTLSNELGIPIVTAGTAEAVAALHTDEQLTTRFDPIALPPWRPRTQETADLLTDFEATIPLPEPSDLASPPLAPAIMRLANPTIGGIWHLLKLAAVLAIKKGRPRIDEKLLEEAGRMAPLDWKKFGDGL